MSIQIERTGVSKVYVDDAIAAAALGGGSAQGSYIISGCQVAYSGTNLDYVVSAGSYYIQGVLYSITQHTVTLANADLSYDRIDVIYADTSSNVSSITGTPGINPSEPSYEPATQIPLRFVIVYANSSVPSGVTTEVIYANDAGAPAEWAWSTSGTGIVVNSTNNPYSGTKDIEATSMASNAYAKGVKGSSGTVDLANYQQLVFYFRFKASFSGNRVLKCQWFASGVAKGNPLTIVQGQFGLDGSNTSTYQAVIIPTLQFAVPAGTAITELRFTDSGGALGFYLDEITLISESGASGGTSGITQAQADARYAQRANNLSDLTSASAARTNLGLGSLATQSSIKREAVFTYAGALIVQTGAIRIYNKFGTTLTLQSVFIAVNTAPTGASIIVDVNKNGTTIFTTQANRPAIAASANTGSSSTLDVTSFADGDYLQADIDQIGSTIAGADLTVHVLYQ